MGRWREDKYRLYSIQDTGEQEAPNCAQKAETWVTWFQKQLNNLSCFLSRLDFYWDYISVSSRPFRSWHQERPSEENRTWPTWDTPPITLGCAESNLLHLCNQTLEEFRTICSPGEQRQRLLACCPCSCITQLSVLFISLFYGVCTCVHMFICLCTCAYGCGSQMLTSGYLFQLFSTLFLHQNLSLNWKLTYSAKLAAQWMLVFIYPCLHGAEITGGYWKSKLRSSHLYGKFLIN